MSFSSRAAGFLVSHSQIIATSHPKVSSSAFTFLSRMTLASNFPSQNSMLDLGIDALLHPGCRCQKQPWMKMQRLNFRKTRSGVPGRSLRCSRYRSPKACANRLTRSSGPVFALRTRDINQERRSGVRRSTNTHSAAHIDDGAAKWAPTAENNASAMIGETLLPIIRNECHTVG